ncbi:MAG: hypothetical protein GY769_12410 [bacterium]|nr:hypothetical protein [bacterium]
MDRISMDALEPLGERLERRGPMDAALAAYLSSRADLMTQGEALELATRVEPAVPTPFGAVRNRFARELGGSFEEAFPVFETDPFDTGLLFQWHRARLKSGEPVIFKVAHSAIDEHLEGSLGRLSESDPSLGHRKAALKARALADFKRSLLSLLDLRREAEDLIELRERCEGMSLVTIPEVHRELCGSSFLVLSDLGGSTVGESCSPTVSENGGPRLARRLCRGWLRLVLSAGMVPADPCGRNALLLDDGKVGFCGGPFEFLSDRTRDQLRGYLAATATGDHESLVDALLELSHPCARNEQRRLRHHLRHTAPFRDGGWGADSDGLSRSLLAHWHQTASFGVRPRRALSAFLRGLALLTREVYTLAPGESSFREAFQELRLYQLFAEAASLPIGGEMAPLTDLPRKLDRGLTLAAGDGRRSAREDRDDGSAGSWSVVLALLSALAAVVLLVHYLAPSPDATRWIEGSGAVVVLILGGLLLRFAAD